MGGAGAELVKCAGCGKELPVADADIVSYGTGYRCERCTLDGEVTEHLRQAARNDAARRHSSYGTGSPYDPDLNRVIAAVEKARHAPAVAPSSVSLAPEAVEPFIEADDARRMQSMTATTAAVMTAPVNSAELDAEGPFRSTPLTLSPRYICIACFHSSSDQPGECPADQVPLSDLENSEAVDELRAHVRKMVNKRESARWTGITIIAGAVAMLFCTLFDLPFLGYRSGGFGYLIWVVAAVPLFALSLRIWPQRKVRNNVTDLLTFIRARGELRG